MYNKFYIHGFVLAKNMNKCVFIILNIKYIKYNFINLIMQHGSIRK